MVSLRRVGSYHNHLKTEILTLLEPLGGFGQIFKAQEKVLLKPNFLMPRTVESGATTHPAVIVAMVELLKDHGCEVGVGDSPGLSSAAGVIQKLGLTKELQKYGAKIVEFKRVAPVEDFTILPFDRCFKNLYLAGEINEFEKIVNLPKLKTHGQMGLTLAVKNLFGCVVGKTKGQWHFSAGRDTALFARLLVETALTVNASLHILDGIIGMDGNGPSHGRLRDLNLLIAGTNPFAVDRVVVELAGEKPEYFPFLRVAQYLGVNGVNLSEITLKGDPVDLCRFPDFQIPALRRMDLMINKFASKFIEGVIKQKLLLDRKLCTQCRRCEEHCPAQAIKFQGRILINERLCIKCCCCQELCPEGALSVKVPWVLNFLQEKGIL